MNKEDYIKAIENLNQELMNLYNVRYYKNYRDKKLIHKFIKTKRYKLALQTKLNPIKSRFNNLLRKKVKEKKYNEVCQEKKGKIVVYTCILDDYDNLYTPLIETDNTRYIVFSDNKDITKNIKNWEYREIPENIKQLCDNKHVLINRYIKMHPFELFPNFDLALYIDGSVRVMSDVAELFYKINDKTGLAMHAHPKRNDVYEEAKACIKSSLGNKKYIKQLIAKYREENFPTKFGLFEATVIAIDLHNKKALEIMNKWWEEFLKSKTGRDQLILTYVLWKLNYSYDDMGILGENLAANAKFRRTSHNYDKRRQS